jgi:hypothetical protein
MAFAPRLLAPIPAPPPPKPPQLNIVASSLMPDVITDTFGPDEGPLLSSGGFIDARDPETGRRMWHRLPGDPGNMRELIEKRNAMVAAIEAMTEVEQKQAELEAGITARSLPSSIYGATADSRWTGGFAYAPENQYRGALSDWNAHTIDALAMRSNGAVAPTGGGATPSITGGALTAAASPYSYVVAGIMPDGSITLPSAAFTGTIASGTAGSNALAWTASAAAGCIGTAIFGRKATNYQLLGTVPVATTSFTDTGAVAPTLGANIPIGNLPMVGFVPFLIQVADQASAIGWKARDYVGRALRLLDFTTPNAIERELWMGAFAQAAGVSPATPVYQSDFPAGMNAFFTQSGTPSNGGSSLVPLDLTPASPPSVTRGIQILEDYLANSGGGGQGMLHVAPECSPNLLGARRIGSLLLSVMDNIIVPGSGYPTTGATGPAGATKQTPDAGTQWMFATDLISVRLDAPWVTPSTLVEALDRASGGEPNLIKFRAQRYAAATWDGARLAGCRVTLAT